jgi:hypothetical protein
MPPICFPAALCSAGVTPLPSSYGGSDSCRALLAERACPGRPPVFTRVIPHRHTVTNHRDGCPSPFRSRREAPTPCGTGDFALRSQARHRHRGRIVFTCHYGLSVGFRCFPPRLTATQSLLLLTGSRQPMGRVFHPAGSRRLTAHDRASPLAPHAVGIRRLASGGGLGGGLGGGTGGGLFHAGAKHGAWGRDWGHAVLRNRKPPGNRLGLPARRSQTGPLSNPPRAPPICEARNGGATLVRPHSIRRSHAQDRLSTAVSGLIRSSTPPLKKPFAERWRRLSWKTPENFPLASRFRVSSISRVVWPRQGHAIVLHPELIELSGLGTTNLRPWSLLRFEPVGPGRWPPADVRFESAY